MKSSHVFMAIALTASFSFSVVADEGDSPWRTDLAAAKAEAKVSGKDLFLFFTGSDWCGFCMKLKEEVLDKPEFLAGVQEEFILVEIDFPRGVTQTEELKKQNKRLALYYEIKGLPTIYLAENSGRTYARTGYMQGGSEVFLGHISDLLSSRDRLHALIEEANELEGDDKANALVEVIEFALESNVLHGYEETFNQIIELDTENHLGFRDELQFVLYNKKSHTAFQMGEYETVLRLSEEFLKLEVMTPVYRQLATTNSASTYYVQGNLEKALELFRAALEIEPDSPVSDAIKHNIEVLEEELSVAGDKADNLVNELDQGF